MSTKKLQILDKIISTDPTLTKEGQPADAKVVGDYIVQLDNKQSFGENSVQSEGSYAFGKENIIGLKGYYYTDIDFDNTKITLSMTQIKSDPNNQVIPTEANTDGMNLMWQPGDIITIINQAEYRDCSTITDVSGNVITVDVLPFTKIDVSVKNYFANCIFVADKPLDGDVDLGKHSLAFGNNNEIYNRSSIAFGQSNRLQSNAGFSGAMGKVNTVTGSTAFAFGYNNTAAGDNSLAEGMSNLAYGHSSHAEGYSTESKGSYSHTEGYNTEVTEFTVAGKAVSAAHAEGSNTLASNSGAHAEGNKTTASGESAHAEGYWGTASGNSSHVEGSVCEASGMNAHAEGRMTHAINANAHAEGDETTASGQRSHAEGHKTLAGGISSHAEGQETSATNTNSHAEGYYTISSNAASHAEGYTSVATGSKSHAEGTFVTLATFKIEGESSALKYLLYDDQGVTPEVHNILRYTYKNSSNKTVTALSRIERVSDNNGEFSVYVDRTLSETALSYANSVCELLRSTTASGEASHAEGAGTIASGANSHAEGFKTKASGQNSHAAGNQCVAEGLSSYAGGYLSTASGEYSRADGYAVTARGNRQLVIGQCNKNDDLDVDSFFVVGMGPSRDGGRSAFRIRKNGNVDVVNNKITNLANGTAASDAVNLSQLPTKLSQLNNDTGYLNEQNVADLIDTMGFQTWDGAYAVANVAIEHKQLASVQIITWEDDD